MPDRWEPRLAPPTASTSAHLDDEQLLRQPAAADLKHLTDCGWCRVRRQTAALVDAVAEDSEEAFEQALDAADWTEGFRDAASRALLPTRVRELMTAGAGTEPVAPGQLWRLTWRGRHLLAAIIAVDAWQVLVAPVTTDADLADEVTLVVPEQDSPLGTDLAVWVRHRTAVPTFTLDRRLGTLPAPAGRVPAAEAMHELVLAHRAGQPAAETIPTGRPLHADDAGAIALADALDEEVAWFAGASAGLLHPLETESGSADPAQPAAELVAVIADSAGGLAGACEQTGIAPGRLLDLRRGAKADGDEYSALARAAGAFAGQPAPADAESWHAALAAVSAPRWRAARRAWTRTQAPAADPDDPTPLVDHLLRVPIAARTVHGAGDEAAASERLNAFWRDRVALALVDYA